MVKKIKLFFKILLPFNRTWYPKLKELGGFYVRTKDGYLWSFPINVLPKVIAVIGEPIEVNRDEVSTILDYCPQLKEKVEVEPVKGTGKLEIHELPDVYEICTIIGKEEQIYRIPKENVLVAWEVMLTYKIGERVPSRKVAEEICRKLGLRGFFRRVGDREYFDWAKFFGSRREYYHYFYLPIKVLEYKGKVIHHKKGEVERISN